MKELYFSLKPSNDIDVYKTVTGFSIYENDAHVCNVQHISSLSLNASGVTIPISIFEVRHGKRLLTLTVAGDKLTEVSMVWVLNLFTSEARIFDVNLANTVVSSDLVLDGLSIANPVTKEKHAVGILTTVGNTINFEGYQFKEKEDEHHMHASIGDPGLYEGVSLITTLIASAGELGAKARQGLDQIISAAKASRG